MSSKSTTVVKQGSVGGFFLITYIGAAVYFLQVTHGFWGSVWGLIEAMFWPAFVVFQVLTLFHVGSL